MQFLDGVPAKLTAHSCHHNYGMHDVWCCTGAIPIPTVKLTACNS
jgi:hypothetical protein